mmetsp:Transcript_20189/g.65206  ORF Transcript_20189/g.65206 Transcript_20189/m.65206 type:complete len:99 (-) Transcript_20189:9-305(-)
MYPNIDGWLSIEMVNKRGERITVFHGKHQVSSPEARAEWMQKLVGSVREAKSREENEDVGAEPLPLHLLRDVEDEVPPPKLMPLCHGKIYVSIPQASA